MDREVLNNLQEVDKIITELLDNLILNSTHVDSKQASVHSIARCSYNMLTEYKDSIDNAVKLAKQKMVDPEYHAPKVKQLDVPLKVYKVNDIDTVLSPYNIEYTLEWYNKYYGDELTIDDIKEIILFVDSPSVPSTVVANYQYDAPDVLYWEQASPDEVKHLGTNIMVQPNPTKLGVIKNIYGDIYVQSNFYQAVEKYKDITEPFVLCSTEF